MSKKHGVVKGSKQANSYTARLIASQARRDEEMRHFGRIYELDFVTIALGRMGWREEQFREFDKKLLEVTEELSTDILEDAKGDRELWYYREQIDRELKEYCGALFAPYDERYGLK